MASRDELIAQLAEAEAAYHDLVMGVAPKVIVHQNGQRIEYNSTTRSALAAYISQLKLQIGGATTIGPMKVWF